jgi:seryl-tRNA synthetase
MNVDAVKGDIEEQVKLFNEKYTKSAPDAAQATKISEWELEKHELLNLRIISSDLPRAHNALLEFKNRIAEALGKKHKIGVREVGINEGYEWRVTKNETLPVERLQAATVNLIKWRGEGDENVGVFIKSVSESDIKSGFLDRIIKEMLKKPEELKTGVHFGHVMRVSGQKKTLFDKEVSETAQKLGWIKRFPGRAQWILLPPAAKLLYTLKGLVIEKILEPMDFHEAMFPKLINFEVMEKMPGYFEHLAEGMFYVTCPPRDPKPFEEFKKSATLKKEIRKDMLKEILPEPEYVLAPAQCEPFYQTFSGEIVRVEDLPVKMYDASGWTWRAEGGGVEGFVRTTEFFRLESVWLGTPEQVLELRDKIADAAYDLADKTLELDTKLVVGAPFYATAQMIQDTSIDISQSVNIPTLDVEVWLPYRGARERSEWLEVGAFTCAQKKYINSFHIKEAKERDVWTGCGGFGLTRWLAGFLAQKGFEYDKWPKEVKKKIKKMPAAPKTVTWP